MQITLNLATRPYANIGPALKQLRIAMAVLVVLGIGFGLGLRALHQRAEDARANVQRIQNQIDAMNKEQQGFQALMRRPDNAQLLAQAVALNKLFDEKTFSWTLAMEDLETVLPGGVQVTSIDPKRDAKTGEITMVLRVVGPRDSADDLVQNLEHSKHFLLPRIVSEGTESTGGPGERLEPVSNSNRFTFELQAEYNTAAAAEEIAEKKSEGEKSSAANEPARQNAWPAHAAPLPKTVRPPLPVTTAPKSGTLPNSSRPNLGPQLFRPNRNQGLNPSQIPNLNSGGAR
jgi:type IV pilus assembly protein PilN